MSAQRLALIGSRDLAHNTRRALFWIWIVLLLLISWGMSSGKMRIQSGDSSVGGTKAHITSEFAVTQQLVIFVPLIYGFFVAVAAGMAVIHDEECQVGEVMHATGLRPGEYIWGKFLAVLICVLFVLTAHVGAMMLFNHGAPAGEAGEFRGPLLLSNYLRPALLFSLPTIVFYTGVSFAVGERTRTAILVFFLPTAVLLGCLFFVWDWSPSWLDPRIDRLLMLIDPAGFRWLNERILKVDRGVKFYNTASVPLDSLIVANRLLFLALGLGAVVLSRNHFAATLRGVSRRAEAKWRRQTLGEDLPAVEPRRLEETVAAPTRTLAELEMTSRAPGILRGTWTVMWAEVAELLSSAGLYLFVPLLVLEAAGPNLIAVGAFDTPLLLTSGTFAVRTFNPLATMLCLLILFYTVETLWRERHTRLAAISLATPVRTSSVLLGKALAVSFVALAVIVLEFLAAAAILLYQGKVKVDLFPFGLTWGLLLAPTLLLWTSFVMVTLVLTRNRYATYGIAVAVLGFTGYRQVADEINWVGNWPLWSAMRWSDISILEFDRSALWLNRILVFGLAVLFIVLTMKFFARRDRDAIGIAHRLRPAALLRSLVWFLPLALVPLTAGSVLWSRLDRGFQGNAAKKLMKDYWRKNIATYLDWPLPDITAVDVAVELDPNRSRLKVTGTYDLLNNEGKPLDQIPLTGGLHWESVEWTVDGKKGTPQDRSRLFVFRPSPPLAPGATIRIGFQFEGTFPDGITKKGGGTNEFILPSGVVLTSFGTSFLPKLGFADDVGVDKDNRYDSKEYPDDHYKGQTNALFASRRPYKTRVKLTGPPHLSYHSVGVLTSDQTKDGLRTMVWESDQPVNFFNVVAGAWEVRKGEGTAVYYHKTHPYNIDEIVEALDASRKYYSQWFRPYPWKELKLNEFAALASYAQGFPTNITFSESIGFLTRSDSQASSAFLVTAHEAAHQWWGNMITPGKGPGGNLLAEGTAHFSTLLLFEQVKGISGRIEFAKRIEDSYSKERSADSERPLVKIDGTRDGDSTVTYDKTGFVLWMLLNQMGREPMLEGIQKFFEVYQDNPDHPVLEDFLAVLRNHAPDAKAFDAFTQQWFFQVVMPEYQLSDSQKKGEGTSWVATTRVKNAGTGTMAVEIAASRGERFPKKEKSSPASPPSEYLEARKTVTLGAGESVEVTIPCNFEPQRIVVDPDVKVLSLGRKAAMFNF